jgi:hypothetical protein
MTDQKAELEALKARIEQLELQAKPAEPVDWQKRIAEHNDQIHQMREARMSLATPPSVIRDFAVLDDNLVKEIALRDARAPTGPSSQGAIPSSQQMSNVRGGNVAGSGTGWQAPIPLSPPPGVAQADQLMDEQDRRDRAELIERDARLKAMEKLAGPKP